PPDFRESPSPSLRAERSNPYPEPRNPWIASSLSLLAMTAVRASANSTQHRHRDHIISVTDLPLQHRIFQLELEAISRADAALGGKGAAKHGAAVGQALTAKTAVDQILHRQHGIERAFLVEHPRAIGDGPGAQDQPVPVSNDVLQLPQHRSNRLVAHLF